MNFQPGLIALMGSGETSSNGGRVFDYLARQLPAPLKISVLETPAGFELNSARVAGRVADYLKTRLQNYNPQVTLVAARRRNSSFSPDDAGVVEPMLHSDMIFLGPGSPSYAVRQLRSSLAWEILLARHNLGAAISLASAATVAVGTYALPVYEIYKVGEDPHWKHGLGLLEHFGLCLAIVPHWNNAEGGAELDTSHCFIGAERFAELQTDLPADVTVLGIDEHTSVILDLVAGEARIIGSDQVHILRGGEQHDFAKGDKFPLSLLGPFHLPQPAGTMISPGVWELALDAERQDEADRQVEAAVPADIQSMAADRQAAREMKDWARADELRKAISAQGWNVLDTPEGPRLEPLA